MTDTIQMFRVDRPLRLRGVDYEPGDVVDLAPMGLPQGRAQQLVNQRRGELVQGDAAGGTPAPASTPSTHTGEAEEVNEPPSVFDDGMSEPAEGSGEPDLVSMTKRQLLEWAQLRGVPAAKSQTKDEIIGAIVSASSL